jgi:streptomycin 6-kinase
VRLYQLAAEWGVELDESFETPSSLIGYGRRDGQRDRHRVVLKVVKTPNDEWHAGAVLAAFGGRGMVRVLEHTEGAMLLERVEPGTSLMELVRNDRDDDATAILANVIAAMSPGSPPLTSPTMTDWARGFARHRATGGTQIPSALLEKAERTYIELCTSQRNPRLLHGDLQHYNVLLDQERGWVAIDPKGVVGEIEYEIGAAMRNPCELPDVFTNRSIIDARLDRFCTVLPLDHDRVLRWSFAQAVLSAVWSVEDGDLVGPDNVALRLAAALDPMVA